MLKGARDHGLDIDGAEPSSEDLLDALLTVSRTLGITTCYLYLERYHFPLGGGLTIAISADSADRVRVETCRLCRPVTTMWVMSKKSVRLAGLVAKMEQEARATV